MHEAQLHEANCFITLTYDQTNLRRSPEWNLTVPYIPP